MTLALFYDTETTGLPLYKERSHDPRQPHIVQLAAKLVDLGTWETLASIDQIVKPDGWAIPNDSIAIHGITNERAQEEGEPETEVVRRFFGLWSQNGKPKRIGHNEAFDARILRIAMVRYGIDAPADADQWREGMAECTMRLAAAFLYGPGRKGTVSLGEAYRHLVGKCLEGAHNAMNDVDACIAIAKALRLE